MNIENKEKQIINEISNPYPIWIIDNFFNESVLNSKPSSTGLTLLKHA